MASARIGVDIGGTFTDLVLLDDKGQVTFTKVSSTPAAPEEAVLTGVERILKQAGLKTDDVTEVLHGTTVGSNTMLQKVGAKSGLITTKGFRDVLEIGRVRTPTMFDLTWDKPVPLVERRYRLEVDERTLASGEVHRPTPIDEVLKAGEFFRSEGVESVAICFINSYKNAENEAAALAAFQDKFPEISVTASIQVLPELREYERTSTTVVNAYVLPALRTYLQRLESGLKRIGVNAPLLVSNSNGGLSSARIAQDTPVFFISSGRSAGVVGAGRLGEARHDTDLVVFDMGGTTASASLIHDGQLARTNEYEFRAGISTPSRFIKAGGYMMRVPTIDVAEVGSGAGSIAWIDAGGLLNVGPISAGAYPGPVCYGIGGERPTVTDANAVLGFLPQKLAGGTMELNLKAARGAIEETLAKPLGISIEQAAVGIREVVNVNMARTIKAVTVERGVDPRDFTLMAFGGSGPVHACDLARTLEMKRVVFPAAPGVFTAMGMLAGAVERYFVRPFLHPLDTFDLDALAQHITSMRDDAAAALAGEGYTADRIQYVFELDMRFRGQDYEIPVAIPDTLDEAGRESLRKGFREAYTAIYGYASNDAIECANVRLLARGIATKTLDFRDIRSAANSTEVHKRSNRQVYFNRESGWVDTPIVPRALLDKEIVGPVILESSDTTIVIPPGWRVSTDKVGSVIASLD
ncbi:hydantoinase/oxoprolinase family protein [Paraburkholderia sp. Tr-20389]|uniref:hydantoinase/oxoprolinase family protein n=1 Tax=Paraburkholderia sp. Tr-20389 TaxID=2703903 RepID=UPI001980395E|nr:hydantoinase/oxoprolinase family protein [Paraburkholderia sp. Tr-20389]MBN3753702.1 hydantoinase/oxoprolinase family protein [Paraburkholderia sp. Tr-20389]